LISSADQKAVQEGMAKLPENVLDLVGSWADTKDLPQAIDHFTDTAGLIGILKEQSLWASLSTSLNDSSEGVYALDFVAEELRCKAIQLTHLDAHELIEDCSQRDIARGLRVFVCSFCAAREAAQWLHYGRSGTGIAIGFASDELYRLDSTFYLYQVRYDRTEQHRLISAILSLVDSYAGNLPRAPEVRTLLAGTAIDYVRLVAPWMKSPAFSHEDEWRLIGTDFVNVDNEQKRVPKLKAEFRTINHRVIPFVRARLPASSVRHIELGAANPMTLNEQALEVLVEDFLGRRVLVTRSSVPVRP
jgi:hypothetical protein